MALFSFSFFYHLTLLLHILVFLELLFSLNTPTLPLNPLYPPHTSNRPHSALYAHKIHSGFWHDVNSPESFGFATHQVTPFNVSTPDNEILYAWHILPLATVAENRDALAVAEKFDQGLPLRLLREDGRARVVVNCEFSRFFSCWLDEVKLIF